MSNRAKVYADFSSENDPNTDNTHIYLDGYVVVAAVSQERHNEILAILGGFYPTIESARSQDGFMSAFILTCEPSEFDHDTLKLVTTGYSDHRDDQLQTIEDTVDLYERAMKTKN